MKKAELSVEDVRDPVDWKLRTTERKEETIY